MATDGTHADQAFSSITETLGCSMDQAASQQTCIKPETNHQSLQIDCRANNSQPDIYHTFHSEPQLSDKEQSSSQDQEAGREAAQEFGRRMERLSRDSREELTQDPTSSHESSRPESLGHSASQTHDKVQILLPGFVKSSGYMLLIIKPPSMRTLVELRYASITILKWT